MSILTLQELKDRATSGEKQQPRIQAKIVEQLKRSCAQPDCTASLAFTKANAKYCGKHSNLTVAALVRRKNREKKQRYNKKHGITADKTVRNRDMKPAISILSVDKAKVYDDQPLVYENYKLPLKKIPKSKGFGYYGTLALTEDKAFVQCHICGNLFVSLSRHLKAHKIDGRRYKEMFELAYKTVLISEPERIRRQQRVIRVAADGKLPAHLIEYNRKVRAGEIKHNGNKKADGSGRGSWSLEKRNKEGLCPDQVLQTIKDLAVKLGHTPSNDEFERHYGGRYIGSIKFQHGSYLNAVKKAGMVSAKELKEPSNEHLLQQLRDFTAENGRIPTKSDFERGLLPSRQMYWRRFGTLNNARIEAGLNAVLPMPFGQLVEVTPEQYAEYKAGHGVSDEAKRQRRNRAKKKALALTKK